MANKSIKKRIATLPDTRTAEPVRVLLNAVLADMTALRTQLAAVVADNVAIRAKLVAAGADLGTVRTALNAVVTKLNADAGVTDADYAAAGALTYVDPAALTAATPAALTTVA